MSKKRITLFLTGLMLIATMIFGASSVFAAQAPSNITAMTNIPNGQTWEGDFTLNNSGGFATAPSGTATVSGSKITSSSSTNAQLILSRVSGTMNLNGITFTQNVAAPVMTTFNNAKINITDSKFTGPGDNGGKGLFIMNNNANSINLSGDNTFENYKNAIVTHNNGVITITGGTTTFKDSDLSGVGGNAKIVIAEGAKLVVDSTHLKSFWIENNGTLKVQNNSDIDSCVIVNNNSTLTFEDSIIHNYSGSGNPSGQGYITMISGEGVNLTFTNTEIRDNHVNREASTPDRVPGASIISLKDSSVIMDKVYAVSNTSKASGGVMHVVDTEIIIRNSDFGANSANTTRTSGDWYGRGGVIFAEDSNLFVENSIFYGNEASEGGAIYVKSLDEDPMKSTINIIDSDFDDNKASRAGGAIVERGNGTTSNILGVFFTRNVAGQYGGALFVTEDNDPNGTFIGKSGTRPTGFDGNMVNNVGSPWTTDVAGGALSLTKAHVRMNNVVICENEAPHGGGGIASCNTGAVEIGTIHGAAIFDNTVSGSAHPYIPEAAELKDVFFYNIDIESEQPSGFDNYPYELYERMFNGGFHNWEKKQNQIIEPGVEGVYMAAQSTPTSRDTDNAEVYFVDNKVLIDESRYEGKNSVTGGAIGSNGLLTIGTGTELKVVKLWDDNNNNDGYRPSTEDEIDWITIKQDGEVIDQEEFGVTYTVVTGSEADQYILDNNVAVVDQDGNTIKFADKYADYGENAWLIIIDGKFPRYKENESGHTIDELYEYTVEEDLSKLQEYLNTESAGNEDTYFELTNKHEDEKIDILGTKVWDDNNDQDGVRPASITLQLLKDGEPYGDPIEVAADDQGEWKFEFKDLPKYEAGREIEYAIEEEAVDGYVFECVISPQEAAATEETAGEESLDNDKVEELDQPVNANEVYEATATNTRESYLKVNVPVRKTWDDNDNASGLRPESIEVVLTANGTTVAKQILNEENGWAHIFTDLDEYKDGQPIEYDVYEVQVPEYTTVISGDVANGFDIVNSYEEIIETTDISVTKVWDDDDDKAGIRPAEIEVALIEDGVNTNKVIVLSEENGWKGEFADLPKQKDGQDIVYDIVELGQAQYTPVITGDGEVGFVVTNTYHDTEKINIPVEKVWVDNNDQAKARPTEIEVMLLADGRDSGKTLTLNAENEWKGIFTELPVEENGIAINYTVVERNVEQYIASITGDVKTGFVITNTYNDTERVNIPVSKIWIDNNDKKTVRPDAIHVMLFENGVATGNTISITAENGWKGCFVGLPKQANGQDIVYTIDEVKVDKYVKSIKGDAENGFVITNAYEGEVKPAKTGDDANTALWIALAAVAAIGAAGVIAVRRKKQ